MTTLALLIHSLKMKLLLRGLHKGIDYIQIMIEIVVVVAGLLSSIQIGWQILVAAMMRPPWWIITPKSSISLSMRGRRVICFCSSRSLTRAMRGLSLTARSASTLT